MTAVLPQRLSILIYHQVRAYPDPIFKDEVDQTSFRRQMQWLTRWFRVLPLGEAVGRLSKGTLPFRAACVTFDDGYADNAEVALPILQEYGVPATFFIATGYVDGGCMWNDSIIHSVRNASANVLDLRAFGLGTYQTDTHEMRRRAIDHLLARLKYRPQDERSRLTKDIREYVGVAEPTDLMLSTAQLHRLVCAGMDIGAHTASHPILKTCDLNTAKQEIASSKHFLEQTIGKPVTTFAYPNGKPSADYDESHVEVVRELGFSAAVTTAPGAGSRHSDVFQLPRFTPWDKTQARFIGRLVANSVKSLGYGPLFQ